MKISASEFSFSVQSGANLIINIDQKSDEKHVTNVFGDKAECYDGGDQAAKWFSDFLGKEVRLSFSPERILRQEKDHYSQNWRLENLTNDSNKTSLADCYPFMLLGEDSLRDVNAKIPGKNYRMATFRPNIVVQSKDGKAWAEDDWVGELHIGDAIFAVAQPCARCIFTTIDPYTCEKSEDKEPLTTLRKFRLAQGRDREFIESYKDSPMVGVNLVLIKEGKISAGDEIILVPPEFFGCHNIFDRKIHMQ